MSDASPGAVVVMTAVDADDVAHRLAAGLVEAGLAACVQVLPVTSHYRWDGALQRTAEYLLMVKTASGRAGQVRTWLAEHHPYDLPEILVLPVTSGSPDYLRWLQTETDRSH